MKRCSWGWLLKSSWWPHRTDSSCKKCVLFISRREIKAALSILSTLPMDWRTMYILRVTAYEYRSYLSAIPDFGAKQTLKSSCWGWTNLSNVSCNVWPPPCALLFHHSTQHKQLWWARQEYFKYVSRENITHKLYMKRPQHWFIFHILLGCSSMLMF